MPKTETFDKYFEEYDGWFEKNHDIYQAELEAVKSLIPPGKKGLEIGVGTAKFAKPLGIEIGVEPSKKMAAKAREAGIMVYEAVAEELPLPNNTFDFVLMVTTICFFENTAKAFREAHRVLKKDGFIAIGFIDSESQLGKTYQAKKEKSRFYREAVFHSAKEVLGLLEKTGFEITAVKQTLIPGSKTTGPVYDGRTMDGYGKGGFVAVKGVRKISF